MVAIKEARMALKEGEIIVYPTDTVWGIGCDPFNQKAVDRLFKVKGKKENGFSILIKSKDLVSEYCNVNSKNLNIVDKLFPGPVTLIMKSKVKFAKGVTRDGNIAVRVPNNDTAISLVENNPIITTSANKHGRNIAKSLDEARKIFGNSCIYVEGEQPKGIESTIINLTKNSPKILRIGALYGSSLETIIGR